MIQHFVDRFIEAKPALRKPYSEQRPSSYDSSVLDVLRIVNPPEELKDGDKGRRRQG